MPGTGKKLEIDRSGNGEFYLIGDETVIQLNGAHFNSKKDYLKDTQGTFKEISTFERNLPANYSSTIKSSSKLFFYH